MKLFYGGYGYENHYIVAENETQAVKNIQDAFNMAYLPVEAAEVVVEGYNIILGKITSPAGISEAEKNVVEGYTPLITEMNYEKKETNLHFTKKEKLVEIAAEKGIEVTEEDTRTQIIDKIKAVD